MPPRAFEQRNPLSTETQRSSEAHTEEHSSGGVAGTVIGLYTVVGGIICLGLLIWFGL